MRRFREKEGNDLQCCGNCDNYRPIALKCRIHEGRIGGNEWCPDWEFDGYNLEKRDNS